MARKRADVLVHERGLAESRAKAQALILAGEVVAGDHRVDKPGQLIEESLELRVKEQLRWVSRGALKLLHALDHFALDARGRVCIDLGASTGGFTEVLLQRGAARVYAVDVGYGQLHARLRGDARVIVREKVNARELSREVVPEPCGAAVADLSFISLRLVLPAMVSVLAGDAWLCALVKPQFEAGRGEVGKGGVVRDAAVHERVIHDVERALRNLGLAVLGTTPSPILGPAGNREFLVAARR